MSCLQFRIAVVYSFLLIITNNYINRHNNTILIITKLYLSLINIAIRLNSELIFLGNILISLFVIYIFNSACLISFVLHV